ncbi:MAG: sigma-70 family RNA polymerase sigma factor [Proteobacteria bacterium]|nr:sigma-70 family RNA polymerase sigma factor [Pseudomonadota bacterium]MBU1417250.1 sigma-70 family RNA polymerase sigma factor [Pseudomonadota bacterium]MBU1455423.1 sigma-70 family RNA polymerase sigma factor [Pseudomonadota bacterium]
MEQTDESIVSQVLQGDTQAFEILICRYQNQIYNLMYRCSRSPEDAADLTQDVFCKTFEKLNHFQRKRSFFSWLYTLSMNHARDWLRKQKRQVQETSFPPTQEPTQQRQKSPVEQVEDQERMDRVTQAMMTLPLEKRELLMLRYHYDHSITELAEIFELTPSAVKMRLHRSLAELQKRLGGDTDA